MILNSVERMWVRLALIAALRGLLDATLAWQYPPFTAAELSCRATRWPLSPRIVTQFATRAPNGPNHLGL